MLAADTGMRPHETLALRWRDWHPAPLAFIVAIGVDPLGNIGPLKTMKKGVTKKVVLIGMRTASLLEEARRADVKSFALDALDPEALVFPSARFKHNNGRAMKTMVA